MNTGTPSKWHCQYISGTAGDEMTRLTADTLPTCPGACDIAPQVIPRLTAFFREPWYGGRRNARVDVVYVGKARGPYTWVDPRVHTILDAAEPNQQGWLGAEMLLHEASHGLTKWLENEVAETARAAKKDSGLQWHTIQFYIVGELLKEVLASEGEHFTPYMYATGLFDRAWKRFRIPVESALTEYLGGRKTLEDSIVAIVRDI